MAEICYVRFVRVVHGDFSEKPLIFKGKELAGGLGFEPRLTESEFDGLSMLTLDII